MFKILGAKKGFTESSVLSRTSSYGFLGLCENLENSDVFIVNFWTYLTPFSSVFIVNFEQVNVSWLTTRKPLTIFCKISPQ